jgi:hypothetical protein
MQPYCRTSRWLEKQSTVLGPTVRQSRTFSLPANTGKARLLPGLSLMMTTPVYGVIYLILFIYTWEDREPIDTIHVLTHVFPSNEHGQMIIHGAWWEERAYFVDSCQRPNDAQQNSGISQLTLAVCNRQHARRSSSSSPHGRTN